MLRNWPNWWNLLSLLTKSSPRLVNTGNSRNVKTKSPYDTSSGNILKKKISTILAGTLIAGTSFTTGNLQIAGAQNYDFAVQFGTAGLDEASGIALDTTGVYVVGRVSGALPGQTHLGNEDAFMRKYDTDGNLMWTRQFGTSETDAANRVSVDSSTVYVVGRTHGALPGQTSFGDADAFITKYDTDGNLMWTRQFGTSDFDEALHVAIFSGGVYVVGYTYGDLPGYSNAGAPDAFMRKYDTDGNLMWTRQFGTSAHDSLNAVTVDPTGVYTAGLSYGALPGQTNAGLDDPFMRKYDTDGNVVWTREELGSSDHDNINDIVLDSSGVYMIGQTWGVLPGQTSIGPPDAYIRKYDRDGDHLWTRQFGTELLESASGLAVDSSGVYAVGITDGIFTGETDAQPPDAFIAKYDQDGTQLSLHNIGTSGVEWAQDIDVNSVGMYAVGWTTGAFPGQTVGGNRDAFLLRAPLESVPGDPAEAVQQLLDDIDNMNLPKGASTSLHAPLKQAIHLLTDDNENNDKAVCNKLDAFTNKVNTAEKSDVLAAEKASQLKELANSIQASLVCG